MLVVTFAINRFLKLKEVDFLINIKLPLDGRSVKILPRHIGLPLNMAACGRSTWVWPSVSFSDPIEGVRKAVSNLQKEVADRSYEMKESLKPFLGKVFQAVGRSGAIYRYR